MLVTLAHKGDHVRKVEVTADGFVHHLEEGGIESEVVGLLKEEIAAGQGSVGFEFLRELVRTLAALEIQGWVLHCVRQCRALLQAETPRQRFG